MRGFTGEIPKAQRVLAKALRKRGIEIEENVICGGREADIILPRAHLIIEVDGIFHFAKDQKEEDRRKATLWQEQGYMVLRFTNQEIYQNLQGCLTKVHQYLLEGQKALKTKGLNQPLCTNTQLQTLHRKLLQEERQRDAIRRGESVEAFFLRQSDDKRGGDTF